MGKYTVIISGEGPLNTGDDATDARKLTERFVAKLKSKGHEIKTANFSSSDQVSLVTPESKSVAPVAPPAAG
jgi:D-Tyr-tRNAtyr deacylase